MGCRWRLNWRLPAVRLLPPAALLARLDQRLPLLSGGARTLPERQRTLRATLDWSYNLLGTHEQLLYRRLGVFAGGWTMEAAEAVCMGDGDPGLSVLDGLATLLDHSLVQRTAGQGVPDLAAEPGDLRFTMLETIRADAAERLEECGESEQIRRRHAEYVSVFTDEAGQSLFTPAAQRWWARLDRELDNIRAALRWLLATTRPSTLCC